MMREGESALPSKVHTLRTWLAEPASWLSLGAVVISASTFFLTYAYEGRLAVILPDRVGIVAQPRLAVVIPLVFTNTGAARTHRHIVEATADLVFVPQGVVQPRSIPLHWELELQFVSSVEFRRRYPNEEAAKTDDQIEYLSRAFAFHLGGGTSLVKVYRFQPRDPSLRVGEIGQRFEVLVRIRTEKEALSFSGTYRCPGALDANYSWCVRELRSGES